MGGLPCPVNLISADANPGEKTASLRHPELRINQPFSAAAAILASLTPYCPATWATGIRSASCRIRTIWSSPYRAFSLGSVLLAINPWSEKGRAGQGQPQETNSMISTFPPAAVGCGVSDPP